MATTTERTKRTLPDIPVGCVQAVAPDGETPIIVRAPRGPGPWWRVKHMAYGSRVVRGATAAEALAEFFREFSPSTCDDADWCKESMRLNGGRIARLPGTDPEPAPQPEPTKTAPAPKKGDK